MNAIEVVKRLPIENDEQTHHVLTVISNFQLFDDEKDAFEQLSLKIVKLGITAIPNERSKRSPQKSWMPMEWPLFRYGVSFLLKDILYYHGNILSICIDL